MKLTLAQLQAKGWNPDGTRIGAAPKPTSKATEDEGELQRQIREFCHPKGWPVSWSRMDRPTTCEVGTLDFSIALPGGKTLWLECKAKGRKPTTEQLGRIWALRRVGHWAEVVWSFEEFCALVAGYPPAGVSNGSQT